jgi:hypothetical protein
MKIFLSITIQEKAADDFRSFCHCEIDGVRWELRGYGPTVVAAAESAWLRYNEPPNYWSNYGYPLPKKRKAKK